MKKFVLQKKREAKTATRAPEAKKVNEEAEKENFWQNQAISTNNNDNNLSKDEPLEDNPSPKKRKSRKGTWLQEEMELSLEWKRLKDCIEEDAAWLFNMLVRMDAMTRARREKMYSQRTEEENNRETSASSD